MLGSQYRQVNESNFDAALAVVIDLVIDLVGAGFTFILLALKNEGSPEGPLGLLTL